MQQAAFRVATSLRSCLPLPSALEYNLTTCNGEKRLHQNLPPLQEMTYQLREYDDVPGLLDNVLSDYLWAPSGATHRCALYLVHCLT